MLFRSLFFGMSLSLAGCASTQLNNNTLELGATADHLLTSQIVHNLSNFIETPTALPAQIVISSGTASTTNTLSASAFDPLKRAVTLAGSVPSGPSINKTTVAAASTLTMSGNNVAAQNWAFEPVNDADQLRRVYALYRFAVSGNDDIGAQQRLLADYPLEYDTSGGNPKLSSQALMGPNCVLCLETNANASNSCVDRERKVCLNRRLLPSAPGQSAWLKWKDTLGSDSPSCLARARGGCEPGPADILIGRNHRYALYVDWKQADRFPEFAIFISVAVQSSASPSSASGGKKGSGTRSIIGPASPTILLNPN